MSICDIYDALRSRRPYKKPFNHDKSLEIIMKGDGRVIPCHFDPDVSEAFVRAADRMEEIFEHHSHALPHEAEGLISSN